jgi:hypothetical protein
MSSTDSTPAPDATQAPTPNATTTTQAPAPPEPFTVDVFKANFNVKVVRYEVYPSESPTCYCVGFIASSNSNKSQRYLDTQVAFTNIPPNSSENDIVSLGWNSLQENFMSWAEPIYNKPAVIGTTFTF